MAEHSDREEDTDRDRPPVRPESPGLANEPDAEGGDDDSEAEDFLPAD